MPEDDPEQPLTLGKRILKARLKTGADRGRGVSQDAMARLVSSIIGRRIVQATWSTYELDELEPPLDVLHAVATLSGLTREWLAWGDAPPGDTPPPVIRWPAIPAPDDRIPPQPVAKRKTANDGGPKRRKK